MRIQPSSGIVAERFALLQQKLIFNAVDATNYVTQAMGHPTHAFDRDKLQGGIILRRARKGEKLKTLDGVERVLDPEDLVVADEMKAIGARRGDGRLGYDDHRRNQKTSWWRPPGSIPVLVRRSSKRHGLHTDASHRFERGADFNAAPVASALVSQLILAAGGHVEGEMVDVVVPGSRGAHCPPPGDCSQPPRSAAYPGRDRRWPGCGAGDDGIGAAGAGLRIAKTARRRVLRNPAQLAPRP